MPRRRFGHYEVIDFLAVLFGYAISGERTLEVFYERLQPFAAPFMALFDREQLPARSTLSRFLASLTMEPVEALRSLFLDDLLARPLTKERQRGELLDRAGGQWEVFDIDGTREAARVSRLAPDRRTPPCFSPIRRASVLLATRGANVGKSSVLAPSFRKPIPQSRLGSFGNKGNGEYRKELEHALGVIRRYLAAYSLPQARALLRLDGQYGTGAVVMDLAGLSFVMRGKDYTVLDHPVVQARLHLPPDAYFSCPESARVAHPLRLPGCPCREDGLPLPRGGGDPPQRANEKPGRRHSQGHRLRTLLHPAPARRIHRLRCGRTVSASWCLRTSALR
jgi:hypothetical protein